MVINDIDTVDETEISKIIEKGMEQLVSYELNNKSLIDRNIFILQNKLVGDII